MSTASRKGLSAVAAAAERERVVLTSHGRAVAVVTTPAELDEVARAGREAALVVTDVFTQRVADRSHGFDLESACERLGVDVERVRARVQERLQASA